MVSEMDLESLEGGRNEYPEAAASYPPFPTPIAEVFPAHVHFYMLFDINKGSGAPPDLSYPCHFNSSALRTHHLSLAHSIYTTP